MWIFPLAACLVSGAFCATVGRLWWIRRRPNLLAWSLALAMFSVASGAAAAGMLLQWTTALFRVYYLFGAILNVPVLAVGTIYLLAPRRVGHAATLVVAVAGAFVIGAAASADLNGTGLITSGIPSGREVAPDGLRAVSRYFSYSGGIVVVAGAVWSAVRLARSRDASLRKLVTANVLIALGTVVVALASAFARRGQGLVFAIGLLTGVCLMFAGFLESRPPAPE